MNWKEKIDPIVKTHLDKQIGESLKHKQAYSNANNPAHAQLWTALANISKEIFEINLKLNYLEKIIKKDKTYKKYSKK